LPQKISNLPGALLSSDKHDVRARVCPHPCCREAINFLQNTVHIDEKTEAKHNSENIDGLPGATQL